MMMNDGPSAQHRLLRLHNVLDLTGVSRSQWYAMMADGRAPRSVPLSEKSRAWDSREIAAWIEARIAARPAVAIKPAVRRPEGATQSAI